MPRILIVEDDRMNQMVLGEMLSLLAPEASVSLRSDGAQALDALREHHYDLVLTDVGMPVMDGTALLKAIRSEWGHALPVVCITAYAVVGERERLLTLGFDAYLSKPVDLTQLRGITERFLYTKHPTNC